jgi:hypothetical protein
MEKQYLSNKELYIEVLLAKHKVKLTKTLKNARTFSKEDNQKKNWSNDDKLD